jgi:hypothetical protein
MKVFDSACNIDIQRLACKYQGKLIRFQFPSAQFFLSKEALIFLKIYLRWKTTTEGVWDFYQTIPRAWAVLLDNHDSYIRQTSFASS